MFCHNCGAKLPENARFCPACGTMTHHSQEKPTAQNIYTTPIQREQPRPHPVQPPVEQPRPQEQIPTNDASAHNPQPVRPNPAPAPKPKQPKMPKKKGSKLPILLALIAAIGSLVFFVSKKESEVTVDQYKPRYDSQSFLFTHEEFVAIYNELLEENGLSITVKGKKEEKDGFIRIYLTNGEEKVGYISTRTDPETGKIDLVNAATDAEYEENMTSTTKAAIDLLFEAACGPLTQEELKAIREMELTEETDHMQVYSTKIDNVTLENICMDYDDTYALVAKFEEEEPQPETVPELDTYYDSEGFLFTPEEFVAHYQALLKYYGFEYTTYKGNWDVFEYQGDWAFVVEFTKDKDSGRVREVVVSTHDIEDETLFQQHREAIMVALEAACGNMSEEDWNAVREAEYIKRNKAMQKDIYETNLGQIHVEMRNGKTDFELWITLNTEQQETEPEPTEAPKPAPELQRNFDEESFLFDAYGFMDVYQQALDEADLPFELELAAPSAENNCNAFITFEGRQVGFLTMEENADGKMNHAILTMELRQEEQWNRSCIDAGLTLFYAGHGALTGAHMDQINNTEPIQYTSGYIGYNYDLDGMKAMTLIESKQILYEIRIE